VTDLYKLTAAESARRIKAGKLHPAELLDSCIERVSTREGAVHAYAYFNPDQARKYLPLREAFTEFRLA